MASLKQWVKKTACNSSVTEVSDKGRELEENTQQKM
jgi:hypothetical protein